jgi:hypothetical protein
MARKPFLLRIDAELLTDLEVWAKDELRSVNGQVEYLLRQAVSKRKGPRSGLEPGTAMGAKNPAEPGQTTSGSSQ